MEPNNPINGLSIRVFISYDTPHAAGRIGDPSCLGLANGLYFDTQWLLGSFSNSFTESGHYIEWMSCSIFPMVLQGFPGQ